MFVNLCVLAIWQRKKLCTKPLPTDNQILEVNRITIWIKEFFTDFFIIVLIHNIRAAGSWWRSALFECSCLQDRKEKILKQKKVFKRYHNTSAVISQPDMKTNKCINYWDLLTIFVVH